MGQPFKEFLAAFQKKDSDQIVSGNCNDIGKATQVFRQISSESRQIGRKDDDVLKSLLKTMRVEKELVLLKKISASPCTIQYWSEEGLRLYHALAEKDTLFWDATGIVVRKGDDSMRMRIPVSAMLTDDQSLPSVQDWIARFRHDEK